MMKRFLQLSGVLCLLSSCSGGPAYYFSQSGVAWASYETESDACADIAKNTSSTSSTYTTSVAGAAAAGFMKGMEESKMRRMNYNNCMTSKGYTRVEMSAEEESAYRKLDKEERQERLKFLVTGGADSPDEDGSADASKAETSG